MPTREENILALARAKGVEPHEITACVLDRPRHARDHRRRAQGRRAVRLITDGDIAGVIATTDPTTGVDIYMGQGGAPEGVLAAAALRCVGGQMQTRLVFKKDDERARAARLGITDFNRKYSLLDLASGDVRVCGHGRDGRLDAAGRAFQRRISSRPKAFSCAPARAPCAGSRRGISAGRTNIDALTQCGVRVARSFSGRRWTLREPDEAAVRDLARGANISHTLARLLAARGVPLGDVADLLEPTLKRLLPEPLLLKDMDKAVARVKAAVEAGEKIAVFGDYDVDGSSSSALLNDFLAALGRRPRIYIPDRLTEGYGPSPRAMLQLHDEGASLVITVDCGAGGDERA